MIAQEVITYRLVTISTISVTLHCLVDRRKTWEERQFSKACIIRYIIL